MQTSHEPHQPEGPHAGAGPAESSREPGESVPRRRAESSHAVELGPRRPSALWARSRPWQAGGRAASSLVTCLSVLAIVGASVIGLNDWAEAQATAVVPHSTQVAHAAQPTGD